MMTVVMMMVMMMMTMMIRMMMRMMMMMMMVMRMKMMRMMMISLPLVVVLAVVAVVAVVAVAMLSRTDPMESGGRFRKLMRTNSANAAIVLGGCRLEMSLPVGHGPVLLWICYLLGRMIPRLQPSMETLRTIAQF